MCGKWFKIVLILFLLFLPVGILLYTLFQSPHSIVIGTGPEGGLYRKISESLAVQINRTASDTIKASTMATDGSFHNLFLLQSGEVDFALYQPGTLETVLKHDAAYAEEFCRKNHIQFRDQRTNEVRVDQVAFVANLYSQPAHFIVRKDAGIHSIFDLKDKIVSLGLHPSGDYSMSLNLLEHFQFIENFGMTSEPKFRFIPRFFNYKQVKRCLEEKTLDAVFITIGIHAPIFRELASDSNLDILDVPYLEALEKQYLFTYPYEIPAGMYSTSPMPSNNVKTIASGAHLLTRIGMNRSVVRKVLKIILDQNFITENQLDELAADGQDFALRKPVFPIHSGAWSVYHPELEPLLSSEFVEGTEGIRSFLVSTAIAIYIIFRWIRQKNRKKKAHKFDKYLRSLLTIERDQLLLDQRDDADDLDELQRLLDEVTYLRQEALQEFTAHEINEDRAVVGFIEMCHALSNKINAKISRQRFDKHFKSLQEALHELKRSKP